MGEMDLRSLLASEALIQNTGVLVDLEVVDGRGVGRRGVSLSPSRRTERRL
jgi:hypothetical protein